MLDLTGSVHQQDNTAGLLLIPVGKYDRRRSQFVARQRIRSIARVGRADAALCERLRGGLSSQERVGWLVSLCRLTLALTADKAQRLKVRNWEIMAAGVWQYAVARTSAKQRTTYSISIYAH